jgi:hypothetical protein
MNRMRSLFLLAALFVLFKAGAQPATVQSTARQAQKPLLFAALPDQFQVSRSELQKIFSASLNSSITLALSNELKIEGVLIDKTQHNPGSVSVNIRVTNYSNALFNITLKLQADNSAAMQGRILHPRYGDVLQLYKEGENYYVKKTSQALFMPE